MNKIVSNVIYFSVFCQKNVVFQRNSVYENKFSVRYGSTKNVCRLFSTWIVNAKTKSHNSHIIPNYSSGNYSYSWKDSKLSRFYVKFDAF